LADPVFGIEAEELDAICDVSRFIGCAPLQTERFLRETVRPILEKNSGQAAAAAEITV
jgi:adenylosuccinate lyase